MKTLKFLVLLGLLLAAVKAQEDPAENAEDAQPQEGEEGEKPEECEEAWEYMEFLKGKIKEEIEKILQETLFEPRSLQEQTVADAMEQTLKIRDEVLSRTQDLRTGEIEICPEQGVNQEAFLTQIRMEIMTVLLSLIEPEAASTEALKDIGRQLLSIRTKVNVEITRIIMLREAGSTPRRAPEGECDCGILSQVVEGLNKVIGEDEDAEVVEEGAEETAEEAPEEAPEEGAEEGAEGGEEGSEDPLTGLTMTLDLVDTRIKELYNEIRSQLDEEKRTKAFEELQQLKEISSNLNDAINKVGQAGEDSNKIQTLVDRDITRIRNDVERALDKCRQNCPSDCVSCGSAKIEEIKLKLADYKAIIQDLEEQDAIENIRTDLMEKLTMSNVEMTKLLKQKAEEGELPKCEMEELEMLEKFKGPFWMMVNVTFFGDVNVLTDMIVALEAALDEMRGSYCSSEPRTPTPENPETCELEEIEKARDFIADIDTIISENLFKKNDDEAARNAMIGLIDLKSSMDERVRQLFTDSLKCLEEVEQIKNIYMNHVTQCLSQMMNPRKNFADLSRSERVECIKQLRIEIEERRGELLLKEINSRIKEQSNEEEYDQ